MLFWKDARYGGGAKDMVPACATASYTQTPATTERREKLGQIDNVCA